MSESTCKRRWRLPCIALPPGLHRLYHYPMPTDSCFLFFSAAFLLSLSNSVSTGPSSTATRAAEKTGKHMMIISAKTPSKIPITNHPTPFRFFPDAMIADAMADPIQIAKPIPDYVPSSSCSIDRVDCAVGSVQRAPNRSEWAARRHVSGPNPVPVPVWSLEHEVRT